MATSVKSEHFSSKSHLRISTRAASIWRWSIRVNSSGFALTMVSLLIVCLSQRSKSRNPLPTSKTRTIFLTFSPTPINRCNEKSPRRRSSYAIPMLELMSTSIFSQNTWGSTLKMVSTSWCGTTEDMGVRPGVGDPIVSSICSKMASLCLSISRKNMQRAKWACTGCH